MSRGLSWNKSVPKYRAKKTELNGIVFDSKKEAKRYAELLLAETAGEIEDLQRQVNFSIYLGVTKICAYRPDFTYRQNGKLIAEDVKGFQTPVFKLKAKLFRACYPEWTLVLS